MFRFKGMLFESEVRRRPGWLPRDIKKFLGEPDEKRPNPYSKGTHNPYRLYKESRVIEVEQSAEFLAEAPQRERDMAAREKQKATQKRNAMLKERQSSLAI